MQKRYIYILLLVLLFQSCAKDEVEPGSKPDQETSLDLKSLNVDGVSSGLNYIKTSINPKAEIIFTADLDRTSVVNAITMTDKNNKNVAVTIAYSNSDSTLIVQPSSALGWLADYKLTFASSLRSKSGKPLLSAFTVNLKTWIDTSDKFTRISDDELLTLTQKQTFNYFWEFGHPTSGMARERSVSGDVVTTGGTGFGIMAMVVAAERNFITKSEAASRIQKITTFLKDKCTSYHGAFAHWVDGQTGRTVAFSDKDNGADLVETSLLFQGLLTARQYFASNDANEIKLRNDITQLWEAVEWDWFRRDGRDILFWHWSPEHNWDMNHEIRGWNECLITYVLAASSPTHPISKDVYTKGWANNGAMKNGQNYYGHTLPLGSAYGGPMFFAHYSFLGLNPKGLSDAYANYWDQNVSHTKINYNYCLGQTNNYYSSNCWGLTASDGNEGYNAHSPTNDKGVIAPTAALSSMPYTPEESMAALHFFYYKLGDKLWKNHGFVDAFNLSAGWYDQQFLAIDQGPIIIMTENHRTGLIWKTFMSNPEIQAGLTKLGFTYSLGN